MTYRIKRESFSDVGRVDYNDISVRFVNGKLYPAVCVKVKGRLRDRLPRDIEDVDDETSKRAYEIVCANWWCIVPPDLIAEHLEPIFSGRRPHAYGDGRSRGWLIVAGIGTPDEWNETQRAAWMLFETAIEKSIKQAEHNWHKLILKEMQ